MEWSWLVRYPSFARIDSIAARSILPIEEVCMSTQANPVLQHGARARRVRDTTRSSAGTNQQSRLTLLFAVLSVVFFLLLIFLRIPSPLYPLMSVQDTIDLLTRGRFPFRICFTPPGARDRSARPGRRDVCCFRPEWQPVENDRGHCGLKGLHLRGDHQWIEGRRNRQYGHNPGESRLLYFEQFFQQILQ